MHGREFPAFLRLTLPEGSHKQSSRGGFVCTSRKQKLKQNKGPCNAPSVAKKEKQIASRLFLRGLFLLFLLFLFVLGLGLFLLRLLLLRFHLGFFLLGLFFLDLLTVVPAQEFLDLGVLDLDFLQGGVDFLKRNRLVGLVCRAGLVLAGAIMLDLLAGVLNVGQAQCGRRALQEVTEL